MRRARIRTTLATYEVAAVVAGAVEPDNTDSMTTAVDGTRVVTTVERDTTGGLHSSVDDYVVNLAVADRLARTCGVDDGTGRSADGDDGDEAGVLDSTTEAVTSGEAAETTTNRDATERADRPERTDDQTDTTHHTHE
jgi:hypothetical protein